MYLEEDLEFISSSVTQNEWRRIRVMKSLSITCIGLGRMGSGIAHNIHSAGFRLTVYNRTRQKMQPFVASGAIAAQTPREAAATADIVVTNLMDDASVLSATLGEDGILAGIRPGAIHMGTTTISPAASTRLAQLHAVHGSHYVAAPVAGRPDAAAAGKLFTFVAGKADWIDRCRPVLEAFTTRIMPMGEDPAVAMSMKLAGNFFVASLLELIGETYVFAEERGVDTSFLSDMLKTMMPFAHEYVDRISTRSFDKAGFTLDAGLKDVRLILDAAAEVHVPLPYASLVRDKCLAAQARGMGQHDWSTLTEIARLDAGQK
ncbi:MAG TPA: NAD(P)-dependent oxidoreductase [Candidatus Acidoferrales bacterium]|nr:NAD(P)-dependent oxidoreductase [Candidatus Acidoferrales bacterium]